MLRSVSRTICNDVLAKKSLPLVPENELSCLTYQGGIGTTNEQNFFNVVLQLAHLLVGQHRFYLFLEVTTLDNATRLLLEKANKKIVTLSGVSPLGVPFNTVKNTASDEQKLERIQNGATRKPMS